MSIRVFLCLLWLYWIFVVIESSSSSSSSSSSCLSSSSSSSLLLSSVDSQERKRIKEKDDDSSLGRHFGFGFSSRRMFARGGGLSRRGGGGAQEESTVTTSSTKPSAETTKTSETATTGTATATATATVQTKDDVIPPATATTAAAATTTKTTTTTTTTSPMMPIRVAYQGVPGAYSDKATRELLGPKVTAIGRPNFEDCFRAVASMECDYACLPIENSLGGSIHDNYDLMLRYDLAIVAEHEFRVHHCLLVKPGVRRQDIKYAISHPQALAQCDNYFRGLNIRPIPVYDTAGSAKMLSEGTSSLPPGCTTENTAAIASDLAGQFYGLDCLDSSIEDDDTNFTRFLLLARKGIVQYLTKKIPAKTSIVFTLPNSPGALYKALSCFSLRDIDCSKIESRPTSASLLNFLKFKSQQMGRKSRNQAQVPRFRYCFYLDFLSSQLDIHAQNALSHLREQADYVRILGSYPQRARLVGPVAEQVEQLKHMHVDPNDANVIHYLPSDVQSEQDLEPLQIGIIGFGRYGQFLAKRFTQKHTVSCLDELDVSREAQNLNVEYYPHYEMSKFLSRVDVVLIAVPLIHFENVVKSLPIDKLRGKLLVDVCPLNVHPKTIFLQTFGSVPDIDILCSHPMLGTLYTAEQNPYYTAVADDDTTSTGSESTTGTTTSTTTTSTSSPPSSQLWDGRPMIYEKVRISNVQRCERFLQIFEQARCQMVEMSSEQHDASIADAEFVTHLTGRLLTGSSGGSGGSGSGSTHQHHDHHRHMLLPPTPVLSKEYAALCDVADMTSDDSFDLFFGMYQFTKHSRDHLQRMRENLATIERQLAAKEAYLAACAEMKHTDRQRLLAETKSLLEEVVTDHATTLLLKLKQQTMTTATATYPVVATTTKTTTTSSPNHPPNDEEEQEESKKELMKKDPKEEKEKKEDTAAGGGGAVIRGGGSANGGGSATTIRKANNNDDPSLSSSSSDSSSSDSSSSSSS